MKFKELLITQVMIHFIKNTFELYNLKVKNNFLIALFEN